MIADSSDNLALAVHRNSEGAVERLVRCYQDRLFSYALRLLQNPADAQEVTQDAFVRACRTLAGRYDESRCRQLQLGPWLFRITRNLTHNCRRSRNNRNELPVDGSEASRKAALEFPAPPVQSLELHEESRMLQRAINSLGPESRDLVLLRFMEEMPYAGIASVVGLSEASVRGKVFRALRRLRAILAKTGDKNAM